MRSIDPHGAQVAEDLDAEDLKPLGSLAQSARVEEIKQTQRILIIIGVGILGVSGAWLRNLPNENQEAIQANNVGPDQVEAFKQARTTHGYLVYGAPALLGVSFIVSGLMVTRFPVPAMSACLVVSIMAMVVGAVLNPSAMRRGALVNIPLLAFLFWTFGVARAYERHKKKEAAEEPLG